MHADFKLAAGWIVFALLGLPQFQPYQKAFCQYEEIDLSGSEMQDVSAEDLHIYRWRSNEAESTARVSNGPRFPRVYAALSSG